MNLYDERGHLTERALTLSPEELTFDQLFERTEHITACSHCAERFALAALAEPEPEPVGLVSRTVAAIETERARAEQQARLLLQSGGRGGLCGDAVRQRSLHQGN